MSIMTRPFGIDSRLAVRFTTIAAVAVAEAIEAVSGRTAEIKWVNDIFVGGRKVCGILTEASFNLEDSSLDYAVIGIGINVYEPEGGFPENIRSIAGAVQPIDPRDPSSNAVLRNGGRNRLAAEVLIRFYVYWFIEMKALSGPEFDPHATRYIDEYRRRCFVIGHEVEVHKAGSLPEPAYVRDVDDDCRLHVTYGDGREEALNSGEISIRI
jgi:BirA family biotin operon repressor/biotin-[acetyl-CoA-carboxylase] ligase